MCKIQLIYIYFDPYSRPLLYILFFILYNYYKRRLLTIITKNYQFTIGQISPLPLEKEVVRLILDKEYLQKEVQYQNSFYLGSQISEYKVVIRVQRKQGLSQAVIFAKKIHAGFPNIKYFLLVGIAGGVPRYGLAGAVSEIMFGDMVVSSPRGNYSRVLQYDKGAQQD